MKSTFTLLFFVSLLATTPLMAQDDLLNMIDQKPAEAEPVKATFKTTRIVNGHSIEQMAKRHLDFRINHRFGYLNSGHKQFWGLDYARVRLSLEYGITDRLMVGLGRNNVGTKAIDEFVKYKLLRQTTTGAIPVSVSLLASAAHALTQTYHNQSAVNRITYCYQVLLARKFTDAFSMQITPSMIHRNEVAEGLNNDLFALGIGGRIKLTRRTSFNVEYFYLFDPKKASADKLRNNLSVGFDIETGGHVFQLHFTNSYGMIEKDYIAAANSDWTKGYISYGFNISRTFSFKR